MQHILDQIRVFLKDKLALDLSTEKTLITDPRKRAALFLGTQIKISNHSYFYKGKNGIIRRATSQLVFTAPLTRIYKKLEEAGFYQMSTNKSTPRML